MLELAKKDYYGVLKLPAGASEPVIRQRFKRLAKRLHPDVNPSPNAASQFREIREAAIAFGTSASLPCWGSSPHSSAFFL